MSLRESVLTLFLLEQIEQIEQSNRFNNFREKLCSLCYDPPKPDRGKTDPSARRSLPKTQSPRLTSMESTTCALLPSGLAPGASNFGGAGRRVRDPGLDARNPRSGHRAYPRLDRALSTIRTKRPPARRELRAPHPGLPAASPAARAGLARATTYPRPRVS